jgi:hypothetical protein
VLEGHAIFLAIKQLDLKRLHTILRTYTDSYGHGVTQLLVDALSHKLEDRGFNPDEVTGFFN